MHWRWVIAAALAAAALLLVVGLSTGSAQDDTPTAAVATDEAQATTEAGEGPTATVTPAPSAEPTNDISTTIERIEVGDPLQGRSLLIVIMTAAIGALVILLCTLVLYKYGIKSGKDLKEIMELGRAPLEGITLVLVVVAVLILASGNRINPQGTIGVLTAIVGYILGRKASG